MARLTVVIMFIFAMPMVVLAKKVAKERFLVGTCVYSGEEGNCKPILMQEDPQEYYEVNMILINPNAPGCGASFDLSVNGPSSGANRVAWHTYEMDPQSCQKVGLPFEGSRKLKSITVQDVYFPTGDFTFRVKIKRTN